MALKYGELCGWEEGEEVLEKYERMWTWKLESNATCQDYSISVLFRHTRNLQAHSLSALFSISLITWIHCPALMVVTGPPDGCKDSRQGRDFALSIGMSVPVVIGTGLEKTSSLPKMHKFKLPYLFLLFYPGLKLLLSMPRRINWGSVIG